MELRIREMLPSDCQAVADLFALCFTDAWTLSGVEDMFHYPGYHNLVALEEDRIIGYIGCLAVMDEADITNVAVDPEFRGKGIATELLKHFLGWMKEKGITHIFLEVRVTNAPAIALYSHAGYVETGVRKNYYSNPKEDALLMMWEG